MGNLVLSRRAGESVKIGDSVTLTVREVHPKKVYVHDGYKPMWFDLGEVFGYTIAKIGDCKVTIGAINKGIVKLLFEADRAVTIVRTELL